MMKYVLACICLISVPSFAANPGTFPTSGKGTAGTLMTVTGMNTVKARMVGRVTRDDAAESCGRDAGGEISSGTLTLDQCIIRELDVPQLVATANCTTGRVNFSGLTLELRRKAEAQEDGVWLDVKSKKLLDAAGLAPSVGRVADQQYQIMCPVKLANKIKEPSAAIFGQFNTVKADCRLGDKAYEFMSITPKRLNMTETSCSISKISQEGGSFLLHGLCNSEGEKTRSTYRVKLTPDGVSIGESDVEGFPYFRCK